jgi:hypothetical protein
MNINEFKEYTTVGLIKEAKDFLGIDISESFGDVAVSENYKLKNIEAEQAEIMESIGILKESLIKLDEALEKNPNIGNELIDIQNSINEEIENHQED